MGKDDADIIRSRASEAEANDHTQMCQTERNCPKTNTTHNLIQKSYQMLHVSSTSWSCCKKTKLLGINELNYTNSIENTCFGRKLNILHPMLRN